MRVLFVAPYRLIAVALAASLLVTSLSGCSDGDAEARRQAAEHRVRAESYLRQGQLRAALIELQNAEQARPGHVETIALMGQAFHALGAYDKALPLFEKLQDAGKLDADSRAEYARVLLRSGRFGQAEALLAYGTAEMLQRTALDEVIAKLRQATQHPEVVDRAWFRLGVALRMQFEQSGDPADFAAAVEAWGKALALDPLYAPVHEFLAEWHRREGRPAEAKVAEDRSRELRYLLVD